MVPNAGAADALADERPGAERRPESTGAVIGIGAALAVILAAVLAILALQERPLDGAAWLAERLDVPEERSSSLEYAEALRLVDGQTVVILRDPTATPEPPADPAPKSKGPGGYGGHGGGGSAWGGDKVDWAALEVAADGGAPIEVAFTGYAEKKTKAMLLRLFSQVRFRGVEEIGGAGGELPVAIGRLDWHGYEASYVHARQFEKVAGDPAFHDTVRVNLTTGDRALVLFARWPRGAAGSPDWLEEFLADYAPRDSDDA